MTMDIATLGIRVDATEARLAAIELEKLSTAGGKTAQSMTAVDKATRLLAGAFAGITAIELAKNIISTNMAMESLRAQLTALTGSALGSEKAFNFIKDFATSTPFEIEGVTKSFIMLQNFGIKPTIGVMNALTNQAAKLGGAQETLAGITLALGQAYSKGKLQAEEMNQMIERGVPVYQILQELTGKNSAALQDMAHKGEITRDVMDGFIKKMGELASGGNAAAMETLRGKISNLSDAWHQFEDALLQDKSEGIMKSILDSMTFIINDFTANLNRGTGSFGEIEKINNKIIAQKETIRRLNDGQGMIPESERPEKIAAANSELQTLLESRQIEIVKYHDVIAAENTRTEGTKKFNETVKEQAELGKKATKTLENLTETNYKLTHSQAEYNKHTLEALGLKGEDLEKALKLANANDALSASSKGVASGTKAAAREQAQLVKTFEDTVTSLSLHNIELSKTPRELQEATYASKNLTKAMVAQLMAIYDIGAALEAKKKLHEAEKSELESLTDQYNKLTLSAHDYYASTLTAKQIPSSDQAPLLAQFDKNTGAELDKKAIEDAKTALDAYNSSLDSANVKTSDLGAITSAIFDGALAGINGMAGAFDSMVNSIDATTEALTKNAEAQVLNNANPDSPEKANNAKKYAQVELDLNDKVLSAKLKAGSQIAGFLSSSLKKGSTEQKAAHAIQMALAGAELAMNLMKLLGIGTVTAAETASVLPSVAASTAKGTAKASEAVATQASAGPYIGFALMAAMAAAMAAIGFATGGGGGSSSGPPPSNANLGTGTVLGDPTAQSKSIENTNELLKSIHADEYLELRGINKGIQTLQGNILSAITKQFQIGAIQGINAPNLGKSGHTMVGGGMMTLAIALSDIMAGKDVNGFMYTTDAVKKTKKGKTTYSYQDYYSPMDSSLNDSLTKVFKSIGTVMSETGSLLGKDIGVDFSQKINEAVIPALKIDTMSMTGEEAVVRANAVISSMLDDLSMSVFGDVLKNYQQLGEGMLETTIRIVAEIAIVKDALHQSGLSITTDVIAVSDAIVQAAGGLEEFQKQFEGFYDNFYTDAEKQARLAERLHGTFAELFPESTIKFMGEARANYRKVIEALDMSTLAGQAQYSMLIQLSEASDTYYTGLEDAAEVVDAITQKNLGLSQQLSVLQGKQTQTEVDRFKALAAVSDESTRILMRQVYAQQDLNTANTAAETLAKTNLGLSQQLSVLQGKQTQTEVDRFKALAAVSDESTKALMMLVYAQQDLNEITKKQRTLELQYMDLTGQSTEALAERRKDELALLDESLRPLQRLIYAEQDLAKVRTDAQGATSNAMSVLQKAVDTEKTNLTTKYNADIKTSQTAIDLLSTSVDKLKSLSSSLKNALAGMVAPNSDAINRKNAQAFIATALILAKSGMAGSIDETQLNDALGVVAKPSEALFSTFEDYQRDFLKTSIDISNLSEEAESQASKAVSQLDVAKSQLDILTQTYEAENLRLDTIITTAQEQLAAINGTTIAVMSIANALAGLSSSMGTLNARQNPVESMYKNFLGRSSDPAGKEYWDKAIKGGASLSDTAGNFVKSKEFTANAMATGKPITSLYQTLLNRAPDAAGYKLFSDALAGGTSIAKLATSMMASPEYAKIKAVRGYAAGGTHEGGWRVVGENVPELENTGASRIFSNPQSKSLLSMDELIAEMKALRADVRAGQEAIANHTRKTAKILQDVTQDGTAITTVVAV